MTENCPPRWHPIDQYMDDPERGAHEAYRRTYRGLRAHPGHCSSLRYAWLPRAGGKSCPSDLWDCDQCGLIFYIEGVKSLEWDDKEVLLCDCCWHEVYENHVR